MKSAIVILAFVLCSAWAFSQDETQYLVGSDASFSGFGGVMSEVSLVRDRTILSFGGGGGVLMDRRFFIGGYGMGNLIVEPLFNYNGEDVSLEMGHGGLWLGYIHKPEKLVHFGLSSRLGWGGIGLRDASENLVLDDAVFHLQPQIDVKLNVLPFMKINLSGGYRTTLGVNNAFFSSTDFNSPYALLGIYFGWFGE